MIAPALAVAVLLATASPSDPAPAPTPAETSAVRDLVEVLVEALNRHDPAALDSRLAAGFTYAGRGGDFGRAILRQVVTGYPKAIARHEVRRVETTEDGFRAEVVLVTADGEAEAHEVLVADDLTLLRADVARIQLAPHAPPPATPRRSGPADRIPDRLEVDFDLASGLIVVDAEVAGRRGRFLVDSGAPLALLLNSERNPDLAETATPADMHGASGRVEDARTGRVSGFRWGALELRDVEVGFAPLSHLEKSVGVTPLTGLIGFGLLERFLVEYDYAGRRLTLVRLDEAGEPVTTAGFPPETTVPVEMIHHIPVLTVAAGDQQLRLGVDSGAEAGLLRNRSRSLLADRLEVIGSDTLTAADDHSRAVEKVRLGRLDVGGVGYSELTFVVADLRFSHEAKIDGLLGYEFLSQRPAAFNFRKGEAYLGRQRSDGR